MKDEINMGVDINNLEKIVGKNLKNMKMMVLLVLMFFILKFDILLF